MQAIIYNGYICIPSIWFAKAVKLYLQNTARGLRASSVSRAAGQPRRSLHGAFALAALCRRCCVLSLAAFHPAALRLGLGTGLGNPPGFQ